MNTNTKLFPLESSILSGEAILASIKKCYSKNFYSCRLYYRSIHDTYIVQGEDQTFYFKVYRFGLRTKKDIQGEIDAINHLVKKKIDVSMPLCMADGNCIIEFPTVQGVRYGVLFTSVGVQAMDELTENDELNERLGAYLGRIHQAWDDFVPTDNSHKLDAANVLDGSLQHIRELSSQYHFDFEFLHDVSNRLKQRLQQLSKTKPAFGFCHGDLYSGNIRMSKSQEPIAFDFDFSGQCWRMYDIALYANAFGLGCSPEGIEKRERRKSAFMEGYSRIQTVSEEMIHSMDLFVPYRRIFNIGTIYCGMANTFGDHFAINNTNRDIDLLKKWLDLNPVL